MLPQIQREERHVSICSGVSLAISYVVFTQLQELMEHFANLCDSGDADGQDTRQPWCGYNVGIIIWDLKNPISVCSWPADCIIPCNIHTYLLGGFMQF